MRIGTFVAFACVMWLADCSEPTAPAVKWCVVPGDTIGWVEHYSHNQLVLREPIVADKAFCWR